MKADKKITCYMCDTTEHLLDYDEENGICQKCYDEQLREFMAALRGEDNNLLGWDEAARASLTMFAAQESIRSGEAIHLAEFRRALLEDPPADSDTAADGRSPDGPPRPGEPTRG